MKSFLKGLAGAGRAAALILVAAALVGGAAQTAEAAATSPTIEITVTPWLAPNAYGSPSYAAAAANAIQGQLQGLSSFGTLGTPTFFQERSNVTSAEVVVTGFPSWLGQADPGSVFGPAFASELGNRMHFGILAVGTGTKFSVSQLSFSAFSTDPFNALAFGWGAGSFSYSSQLQGILFGGDGQLGGGDDSYITSGLSTQLVDAIVGRGAGNSFAAYCPGCTPEEQQAEIDKVAAYPGGPFQFTGTYSIGQFSGSATFNIDEVPEPASLLLLASGVLGLGLTRRLRGRRSTVA